MVMTPLSLTVIFPVAAGAFAATDGVLDDASLPDSSLAMMRLCSCSAKSVQKIGLSISPGFFGLGPLVLP
jgi:hypothetical protein